MMSGSSAPRSFNPLVGSRRPFRASREIPPKLHRNPQKWVRKASARPGGQRDEVSVVALTQNKLHQIFGPISPLDLVRDPNIVAQNAGALGDRQPGLPIGPSDGSWSRCATSAGSRTSPRSFSGGRRRRSPTPEGCGGGSDRQAGTRPLRSAGMDMVCVTLCWRETDSNHRSRARNGSFWWKREDF
jgi:hypothetical protein